MTGRTVICPIGTGVIEIESTEHCADGWPLPQDLSLAHDKRQSEWRAGRRALERGLKRFYSHLGDDVCEIQGYQRVEALPEIIFSISHTDELAGAWVLPSSDRYQIGFDLEESSRRLSDHLSSLIANQHDLSLPSIIIWSLKEAVYKSLSSSFQTNLRFSDVAIRDEGRFEIPSLMVSGHYEWCEKDRFIYAFAWIERASLPAVSRQD